MSKSIGKSPPPPLAAAKAPSLEDAFARYQPELLGALVCLVGNVEDARDALQESFIKCWRNQHQLPEVQNLKAWIFRIVLNTGRDLRAGAWRRRRQALPEDESMLESRHDGPIATVEAAEQADRIRRAVRLLRAEEQEVFLMRQNGDMTYEEIAETLGVPTGTVKTRMRLALIRLRETLGDE